MRTTTLFVMTSLIASAMSCKPAARPDQMTATQMSTLQAIDATENEISHWISLTRYHAQRSGHSGIEELYYKMLAVHNASEKAITGINSGKLSFQQDSLSQIKRNIIKTQSYSNESMRYWRDSMVYSFDTLPSFTFKEEAILSIKLLELLMISDMGRSYTVCAEYEDAPLFWVDDHTVVAILGSKHLNIFNNLDTIHIISGWLNHQILKPEQYRVQTSNDYCMITIAVPDGYDKAYIETGFEYTYSSQSNNHSKRNFAWFIGYKGEEKNSLR